MNIRPDQFPNLYAGWDVINTFQKETVDCSLNKLLAKLFEHLAPLDWLTIERRGAILLKTTDDQLVLYSQYGFQDDQAAYGAYLAPDRCACASAIRNRAVAFTACDGASILFLNQQDRNPRHFILPLIDRQNVLGVVVIFVPPDHQPDEIETALMEKLGDALSVIVSRLYLEEILLVKQLELKESKIESIQHLGRASDYRDNETGMHVLRMSHYAGAIAKGIDMSVQDREVLTIAAPMHDVGKIGISDTILLKPGKLTEEEFAIIKTHSEIGFRILDGEDHLIKAARDIAASHHEKWDGSGYPLGIKGEEISLFGRICSIADTFDALTSARPYKKAWPVAKAIELINKESGHSFDPTLVAAFLEMLPEILRIKELFRDNIIDPREKLLLPPLPDNDDEWIPWNQAYSVDIDTIDEHHKYLFRLTNTLHDAIAKQKGSQDIASMLSALRQYTLTHFREEERMMHHYGYRYMDAHVDQHRYFISKLNGFWEIFKKNPLTVGFEMIYFLRDWLIDHIQKVDRQMGALKECQR